MTDYISREDAISVLSILADKMSDSGNTAMQQGISAIASLPAADVVEVVYCKDCVKSFQYSNSNLRFCERYKNTHGYMIVADDDFCSHGFKRGEEDG